MLHTLDIHSPSLHSRNSMQNLPLDIPPFTGYGSEKYIHLFFWRKYLILFFIIFNWNWIFLDFLCCIVYIHYSYYLFYLIQYSIVRPSTSASFRVSSQPIKILEIPPYRKSQLNQNLSDVVNPSPPCIQEIPPFRPRKSNDWQPTSVDNSNSEFQQLQLPHGACPEWVRRLKHVDPLVIHRSVDNIANKVDNQYSDVFSVYSN